MADVVVAAPELIAQAATDLAAIDSALRAAHLTATAPTQGIVPSAADEVSGAVAQLFAEFGRDYQSVAGQVAAYHEKFVQQLGAAAGAYAGAESASAASLQPLPAATLTDVVTSIIGDVTSLFFQLAAALYYVLFLMLIPIYAALAIYLPFAYLGSLLGI